MSDPVRMKPTTTGFPDSLPRKTNFLIGLVVLTVSVLLMVSGLMYGPNRDQEDVGDVLLILGGFLLSWIAIWFIATAVVRSSNWGCVIAVAIGNFAALLAFMFIL